MAQRRSPWNTALDDALAVASHVGLTASEFRFYLALLRLLLGWNRLEGEFGRRLLRNISGLDGRTFERARSGLMSKGLIVFDAGENEGVNSRGYYRLTIGTPVTDDEGLDYAPPSRVTQTPVSGDADPRHESGHALLQSSKTEQGRTPVSGDEGTNGSSPEERKKNLERLRRMSEGIFEEADE